VSQTDNPVSPVDTSTAELKSSHGGRKPSIHFLGKRSKISKEIKRAPEAVPSITSNSAHQVNSFVQVQPSSPVAKVIGKDGVDYRTLKGKGLYGRPKISDFEREAIESGGATIIY
jgi:hypothetical protein